MATFSRFALSIALLAASGCTAVDHGLGEALKYDMAMQTIDPDPVYPPGGYQPGQSGELGANAVQRYLQGTVKDVVVEQTSSSTTGSSSGPK